MQHEADLLRTFDIKCIFFSTVSAESYRSHRKESLRRDIVSDGIEALQLRSREMEATIVEEANRRESLRVHVVALERVVDEIVGIGLRGGWYPAVSRSTGSGPHRTGTPKVADDLLDGSILRELLSHQD